MKNHTWKQWGLILLVLLVSNCNRSTEETLLLVGDAELTKWHVDNNDFFTVLVFSIENPDLPSREALLSVSTVKYLFTSKDQLNTILDALSNRELLEAEAFEYIAPFGNTRKIIMPASMQYLSSFFVLREKDVIIKNPYNGNDISLIGVDYVKFKGSPLLAVPKP